MVIMDYLAERFIAGRLPLPDSVLQGILNLYLGFYYHLDRLVGRKNSFIPPETEEIAVRSSELMESHYNLPLQMFTHFLGPSMKYSMGLWETGAQNLEQAQEAMMADLCAKAGMENGHTVLDIGCGFGSLAEHLLRLYPDCEVHGLTLSRTQADYIRDRQAAEGHPLSSGRFKLIHGDFNDTEFNRLFDRIFSIGVFEHISNLDKALEKIRAFITDEGRCLLHYITFSPRPGEDESPRQDPFMDRHIFPGGRVWSHTEMSKHQSHFRIEREWFLSGENYRRTMRAWLDNFRHNQEIIHEETGLDERKLKLWELYLRSCVAVFHLGGGGYFGNSQFLLRAA